MLAQPGIQISEAVLVARQQELHIIQRNARGIETAVEGETISCRARNIKLQHAAERVFRREGIDPTRLFARVVRRNNDYPDVVGAILSGRADMAVVPACLLETLGNEGLADVSGLRVLESEESKSAPVIPCRYSTELYPDISLLALPHAPSNRACGHRQTGSPPPARHSRRRESIAGVCAIPPQVARRSPAR